MAELEAGLAEIRQSPPDEGVLALIVRRPSVGEREILAEGVLDPAIGLEGDDWINRRSAQTPEKPPNPDVQITIMNARAAALVARDKSRWSLAGDQLFIDLDLRTENLPPGTQLSLGSAVIEITAPPHNGCKKFVARFGMEAMEFVNSPVGKELHLRGIHARVIQPGVVRVGDIVRKKPVNPPRS